MVTLVRYHLVDSLDVDLGGSPGRRSTSRLTNSATAIPASLRVASSVAVSPRSAACSVTARWRVAIHKSRSRRWKRKRCGALFRCFANRRLVTKREDLQLQVRTSSKNWKLAKREGRRKEEKRVHRGSRHDRTNERNLCVFISNRTKLSVTTGVDKSLLASRMLLKGGACIGARGRWRCRKTTLRSRSIQAYCSGLLRPPEIVSSVFPGCRDRRPRKHFA